MERTPRPLAEAPEDMPPAEQAVDTAVDAPLTPEEQHDAQTRLADAEILGKSFQVRIAIDRNVTSALNKVQEKRAEWRNALSAPKQMYLENRYEAAEDKYQRKAIKVGTSHFKFINNHHQRVANKYKSKRDMAAGKLNAHTAKMEGRLKSSEKYKTDHNRLHQRKIEMYKDRKSLAEGRKELRRARRDMLRDGKSRMEVTRALQRVSPDQMKRIGAIACVRERTVREAGHLEKQQRKASKQEAKLDTELATTMEFAEDRRESLERAQKSIGGFENFAKDARDKATSLQEKLDELPEDSEERAEVEQELAEAQEKAEKAEALLARQKEKVADLEDQITHLSAQVEQQRAKVQQHAETVASLHRQSTEHSARVEQFNAQTAAELGGMRQPEPPQAAPAAPTPATPQPSTTNEPEPAERN
jgi:DNA repair exonuclease SbcCD ATPase subunit